ncbi:hypothetical protein, partial [Staphylococcus epidermidis]
SDVDVLVESETLVLVDSLKDMLALFESLTLIDVDALSDVDALVESETLVLDEPLNDVLALSESLSLVDVDALSDVDVLVDSLNDVLALLGTCAIGVTLTC